MTQTEQHNDLDQARRAIELFHQGEFEAMRPMMADDIRWRVPKSHPLSADIVGVDNVMELFKRVRRETKGSFTAEVLDLMASRQHVVALMHMRAERDGKRMDQRVVSVWKLGPDGKVTERELFMEDRPASAEFWAF